MLTSSLRTNTTEAGRYQGVEARGGVAARAEWQGRDLHAPSSSVHAWDAFSSGGVTRRLGKRGDEGEVDSSKIRKVSSSFSRLLALGKPGKAVVRTKLSVCLKKVRFASEEEALESARSLALPLRPYRCDRCGHYHLTSRTKGKRVARQSGS